MTHDEAFDVAPDESAVTCNIQSPRDAHRIVIAFRKSGQSGTTYQVTYRGQMLIKSSRVRINRQGVGGESPPR
jgi:hypothetical protein